MLNARVCFTGLLGIAITSYAAACGCGFLQATSKCPGCSIVVGDNTCNCCSGTCKGAGCFPFVSSVDCKSEVWDWDPDEDGFWICQEQRICSITKHCDPSPMGIPCNSVNKCSTYLSNTTRWVYFVFLTDCGPIH